MIILDKEESYMRHAFISFGEYDILNQYDITFSSLPDDEAESFQKTWNETMTQRGFDLSIDKMLLQLFSN